MGTCPYCGNLIAPNARSCPKCGARFRVGVKNPGRSLATGAMVCAFLFPLIGFIMAFVSKRRSREAGWPPEKLANAAIPVSVIVFLLAWAAVSS